MENQDLNEVTKSLRGQMIMARASRVNDALIQFMNKPMRARDRLKGNWIRLVILIQANKGDMSCGLVDPF